MPELRLEIKKYDLARMTNHSNVRAVIFLYSSNESVIARLEFQAENVPTNVTVQNPGTTNEQIRAYYPIEAYPDVADILRNEKPVWFTCSKELGYARVETGKEPVGEGGA